MTTSMNEKSLLAEILDDIREKIKKIPLLAQIFIFNSNSYFSKLTTVSFYYATFVSVIYLILFTIIYMRDPYDLYKKYPTYVLGSMLFLFFFIFITYFFINNRQLIKENEPTRNTKSWWYKFVKKFFGLIGTIGVVICIILLSIRLIKQVPQITNIASFLFKVLALAGAGALVYLIFKKYLAFDNTNRGKFLNFIRDVIFYIPCLLIALVEYIKEQWKITTKTEWLVLGGEIVFIGLAYIIPYVYQKIITHDGEILLKEPHYLSNKYDLGNFQSLSPITNKDNTFKYNYSISLWFNIYGMAPNTRASYNDFTNIINYGNKPSIQYNASTNTLRVITEVSHHMHPHEHSETEEHHLKHKDSVNLKSGKTVDVYTTNDVQLQKWNNIVINYDAGYMDVFLNGELVGSKSGVSPYMKYDTVNCGENRGIEGGICNITYYDRILSKGEIVLNYKLLSQMSPPLL